MDSITALAGLAAIAAAARSTWSPCGVSMLSTITPVTEASRGRRYGVTVAWFLAGAVLGGSVFGALAAVLAVAGDALDLTTTATLGTAAALALVAAAFDAHVGGLQLPGHGRQVNETWLTRFRSWVYGGGFGWQIGVGLATYIVTAGVYLTLLLAGLTASPVAGVAIGVAFGLTRGLAIFLGTPLTTHEKLAAFHRGFEGARERSRRAMIGVQLALAVAAAGLAWGAVGAIVAAVASAAVVVGLRPEVMRVRPTARGVSTRVELGERPAPAEEGVPSFAAGR
jgi:hypothetical protein